MKTKENNIEIKFMRRDRREIEFMDISSMVDRLLPSATPKSKKISISLGHQVFILDQNNPKWS